MSLYDRVRDDSAEQNNPVNCFARGGGFPNKKTNLLTCKLAFC